MKDWFKARNIWGAAFFSLSDAEAGRLAKALWQYTMTGEQQNLSGAERGAFAMILMTLGQDEQAEADISRKRAVAGSMGAQAKQANAFFATTEQAKQANASNKNKEEEGDIKENPLKGAKEKQTRFTAPTVEKVAEYCRERNNGVDPQRFVDFYEAKGWRIGSNPMKDWKAAVRTWEQRDSNPGKAKTVSAQQYEQRRYSEDELLGVSDDLMAEARAARDSA